MYRSVPTVIALALLTSVTPIAVRAEEAPEVIVPDPGFEPISEPPPPATVNPAPPAAPAAALPPAPSPPPTTPPPVTTLAPASAPRPEARFGDAGVRVVGGMINANRYHSTAASPETTFTVAPTFDYFLAPSFSAGASVVVGYTHTDPFGMIAGFTNWTFGVTGQLGFDVWLGERLSLWPKVALAFEQMRMTSVSPLAPLATNVGTGMTNSTIIAVGTSPTVSNIVSAQIYAPLLFQVAPHFFLGFGPSFTADLHNSTPTLDGGSNRRTIFGASSLVGGWF